MVRKLKTLDLSFVKKHRHMLFKESLENRNLKKNKKK